MINIKLLKEYMNKNELETFEELADELGEDRAELKAFIVRDDHAGKTVGFCEKIAKHLQIPVEKWGEVFFFQPAGIMLAPSEYSVRSPEVDEDELLGCFQSETIRGEHNVLDELLIAWQLCSCYTEETPENLKAAAEAAMKAIPADAFPEELVAGVEDAATMHGFALGVQFALDAMQHNGPILTMLRQGLGI